MELRSVDIQEMQIGVLIKVHREYRDEMIEFVKKRLGEEISIDELELHLGTID